MGRYRDMPIMPRASAPTAPAAPTRSPASSASWCKPKPALRRLRKPAQSPGDLGGGRRRHAARAETDGKLSVAMRLHAVASGRHPPPTWIPSDDRLLLILRRSGLSFAQIGRRLGRTSRSVQSRLLSDRGDRLQIHRSPHQKAEDGPRTGRRSASRRPRRRKRTIGPIAT